MSRLFFRNDSGHFILIALLSLVFVQNTRAAALNRSENKTENKNVSFSKAFLEFSLADLAPEQYLQSSSADDTLDLILKTNPRLLPTSVSDLVSAKKFFSFHPLAMSSEFIYLNSLGNVYRVMVFDPSEVERMKSGKEKSLQLKWKDPDTLYVHSMRASLKMVDPQNDNYDSSFSILPYSSKKSFEEARVEIADGSNASELVSLSLMVKVEDLLQAVGDESRKNIYEHKVTKKSFLQAVERSKTVFKNDSFMLKFLEKVSSGLTSLE